MSGNEFSPKDAFEFLQNMWNPMAAMPNALFPTLDPAELEKKINDLKVVESWLKMSTGFVQMSIQTMEMQKSTLEAMQAGANTPTEAQGKTSRPSKKT